MGFPRAIDSPKGKRSMLHRGHFAQCPYCYRPDVVCWENGEPNYQHKHSFACEAASGRLSLLDQERVKKGERHPETGRWLVPNDKRTYWPDSNKRPR